jgi:hypothetical protein
MEHVEVGGLRAADDKLSATKFIAAIMEWLGKKRRGGFRHPFCASF